VSAHCKLAQRLTTVHERIAAACERAGRAVSEVTLVAVSKTVEPEVVLEAAALDVATFGENRAQELVRKRVACPEVDFHFIGSLQRNKVRVVVDALAPHTDDGAGAIGSRGLIHSVDSLRLLEAINRCAAEVGVVQPVLVQVNVSGEESKHGVEPHEVRVLVEAATAMSSVAIKGLMTMAPFETIGAPEEARIHFTRLRELRDELQIHDPHVRELSMGMTNDFEVAIEEGATLVRIGSAIFA